MADSTYHFRACLRFPYGRMWVIGCRELLRVAPQDCSERDWAQETDVGPLLVSQWAHPPGSPSPGSCPPATRRCWDAFFPVVWFVVFTVEENSIRKKHQWKLNHWPSSYFIALAEVIFGAIMTIFGWWFLVHSRCEFLCWRLSCLYLIKVKFPDLNPVTFPSVFHAMRLWCQPLNMCLEGKRSVSGYYFDSLPHHCFCLHPDVPGKYKDKKEQVKCL